MNKGFTLLELLVVVIVLAIMGTHIVFKSNEQKSETTPYETAPTETIPEQNGELESYVEVCTATGLTKEQCTLRFTEIKMGINPNTKENN